MKAVMLLPLMMVLACLAGCDTTKENVLLLYPMAENQNGKWEPMPPVEFEVDHDCVLMRTSGVTKELSDCTIKSSIQWHCDSPSYHLGYSNGCFWIEPEQKGLKYASQIEYNCTRCLSEFQKVDPFRACYRCVAEWQ